MKKLFFVSCICFLFMIIEAVGGIYSDATAILADAAHMFSDVAGFMISFVSIYISKRATNFDNSYGYHRVEVLGAIVSVMFIWILLVGINALATYKIIQGNTKEGYRLSTEDSIIFLATACFGLSCNLLNLLALNCFCNPEDGEDEEDENHSSTVSSIKYSTNQTMDVTREENT
jgi:cation diffusion facilitator family transporter